MTFYGLTVVFMTQPPFASLRWHSGLPCSKHVCVLWLKPVYRPPFLQNPHLASFLEKPVHLWLSRGNGLELFTTPIQLTDKVLMQRNRPIPFLVWSEPLAWKQPQNLMAPSPNGVLCLGSAQAFWLATPSSFQTKWEGQKQTSSENLLWVRLERLCRSMPDCTRDLPAWCY